jgi:hypothetical protein
MIARLERRESVCVRRNGRKGREGDTEGTPEVKIGHAVGLGSRARGSWRLPWPGTGGRQWRRRPLPGGPSMEVDKQLMYGVAVAMADECLSWH